MCSLPWRKLSAGLGYRRRFEACHQERERDSPQLEAHCRLLPLCEVSLRHVGSIGFQSEEACGSIKTINEDDAFDAAHHIHPWSLAAVVIGWAHALSWKQQLLRTMELLFARHTPSSSSKSHRGSYGRFVSALDDSKTNQIDLVPAKSPALGSFSLVPYEIGKRESDFGSCVLSGTPAADCRCTHIVKQDSTTMHMCFSACSYVHSYAVELSSVSIPRCHQLPRQHNPILQP